MHVFRISIEFTTKGAVVNARVFNNIHVDSFLFLQIQYWRKLQFIEFLTTNSNAVSQMTFFNMPLTFFEDTEYVMP